MSRRRPKPEEIVAKLCQAEVLIGQRWLLRQQWHRAIAAECRRKILRRALEPAWASCVTRVRGPEWARAMGAGPRCPASLVVTLLIGGCGYEDLRRCAPVPFVRWLRQTA